MFDFRGADSEGQSAKGSVSRGVRITANNGEAWHGETQLRPDHVHDSLILVTEGVNSHPELCGVITQGLHLSARSWFCNRKVDVEGWSVVVFGCNG